MKFFDRSSGTIHGKEKRAAGKEPQPDLIQSRSHPRSLSRTPANSAARKTESSFWTLRGIGVAVEGVAAGLFFLTIIVLCTLARKN
jgi:hypothetical protein